MIRRPVDTLERLHRVRRVLLRLRERFGVWPSGAYWWGKPRVIWDVRYGVEP